jgi:predicted Rossmann fold flavoprotein
MKVFDVIVIGAGAAGVMAAGRAASLGKKVLLLEKMEKPLRKLRISGKGRGNITNVKPLDEFLKKVNGNADFLRPSFNLFFNQELIQHINKIGVKTAVERGGRVFPTSQKAWDVAEALVKWIRKSGVELHCNAKVNRILFSNNVISGVEVSTKEGKMNISCKYVILTTGGASYPATGSTGDGYKMAQQLGHSVTPIRPSLVPLETSSIAKYKLKGLSLRNINVSIVDKGTGATLDQEFGELTFFDNGITGPIILRVSHTAVDAFMAQKKVLINLDLKPSLSETMLKNRLLRELESGQVDNTQALLRKLMPVKIIPFFAANAELQLNTSPNPQVQDKIVKYLKSLNIPMTGYRPFSEAIATAGGISLDEVDSNTMQSKVIKGLYFAGEVLDVDADTGGYNLQIAFSTGWLSGCCKDYFVKKQQSNKLIVDKATIKV